jgi:hypothetical protein
LTAAANIENLENKMSKVEEKIMILEGQIKLCNQHERPSEPLRQLQSEKSFLQSEKQQLHAEKLVYMQSPPTGSRKFKSLTNSILNSGE